SKHRPSLYQGFGSAIPRVYGGRTLLTTTSSSTCGSRIGCGIECSYTSSVLPDPQAARFAFGVLMPSSSRRQSIIAVGAALAIMLSLMLRFSSLVSTESMTAVRADNIPLLLALSLGGAPLVFDLLRKVIRREVGADLLAGISIVTSVLLGEYLAGTLVVLM